MASLTQSDCCSSRQVLGISELVTDICRNLDRSDCARLLQVSRFLFHCSLPFVWDKVPGAVHVLALLPGIDIEQCPQRLNLNNFEKSDAELAIHLPESFNWDRLMVYAPYVRILEVLDLPHTRYKVKGNWEALRSSMSMPWLLPNLQDLSLTGTHETVHQSHRDWLSVFLGPTLRSVRILSYYSHKHLWLDREQFHSVLSDIIDKCPKLETLHISPRQILNHPLAPLDNQHLSSTPGLQGLRQLSSTLALLRPDTLSLLGNLPLLESLVLNDSAPGYSITDLISVNETAFPNLKRLELNYLDVNTTVHLCRLAPLVNTLTTAAIKFPFFPKSSSNVDQFDPFKTSISNLSRLSPHLQDLAVTLYETSHQITLDDSVIEAFRKLPLKTLILSKASLALGVTWDRVLAALPRVEVLRLCCHVKASELETFSIHLPQLSHLELQFIVFSSTIDCAIAERENNHQNGGLVCLAGEVYVHDINDSALNQIARYLSGIWPKVMCEIREWDTPSNIRALKALNHCISKSRIVV